MFALHKSLEDIGDLTRFFAVFPIQHAASKLIYSTGETPPYGIATPDVQVALKEE